MILPPDQHHGRWQRWHPAILLLLVILGLGVSALEKWRQPEVYRLWGAISLRSALDPVMRATRGGVQFVRQLGRAQALAEENRDLRNSLTEARLEAQFTAEELRRVQRLSGLGQWSGPPELTFMMADVIGLVTNEESAEMVINRGAAHGVWPRDPVVALGGLIGLVQSVDERTAHVQALSDPLSAVGVVATQNRARGVVYGRGRGHALEFIPENEVQPIEVNSTLVTSGFENSVYPKGIVVGRIVAREANMYGMPYGAVQPVVPFESIEEVLLVVPRQRSGAQLVSTNTLGRFSLQIPLLAGELDAPTTATGTAPTSTTLRQTTGTLSLTSASTATLNLARATTATQHADRPATAGLDRRTSVSLPRATAKPVATPKTPTKQAPEPSRRDLDDEPMPTRVGAGEEAP